MPTLSTVFGSSKPTSLRGSKESLVETDEHAQLRDSLRAVAHLMNDDVERAQSELQKGSSVYHKLGLSLVSFLRAVLGFEREYMAEAQKRATAAEAAASDALAKAQKTGQGFKSEIYPIGTEYVLCHAQAQLMAAVIGVLTESVTEALKGFWKVRKSVIALQTIGEAEKQYMQAKGLAGRSAAVAKQSLVSQSGAGQSERPDSKHGRTGTLHWQIDEEDDIAFVDAEEAIDEKSALKDYRGHIESNGIHKDLSEVKLDDKPNDSTSSPPPSGPESRQSTDTAAAETIPLSHFTNPTDLFIHTGYLTQRGLLLLMTSLIPPTWGKILSVIGFAGDRDRGLAMLWEACEASHAVVTPAESPTARASQQATTTTATPSASHSQSLPPTDQAINDTLSINGAIAGLVVLGYHSSLMSTLDILPADSYPLHRCRTHLTHMRTRFPQSRMWLLEASRMHSVSRDLPSALRVLDLQTEPSPLKQVEALKWFEHSICCMCSHQYESCTASLAKFKERNNWSPAVAVYLIGSCYLELYRTAVYSTKHSQRDASKAQEWKRKAEEAFAEVPRHAARKKLIGKPLPLDAFVQRKIGKWRARARERGVELPDAVGVSPLEEMMFLFGGYKRMSEGQLLDSLGRLWWPLGSMQLDPAPRQSEESTDEKGVLAVLSACILRQLGDTAGARRSCEEFVMEKGRGEFAGEDWVPPVARLEVAACAWDEANGVGKTSASESEGDESKGSTSEGDGSKENAKKDKLRECKRLVEEVARWGGYELDARFGIKVTTALDTLRGMGVS